MAEVEEIGEIRLGGRSYQLVRFQAITSLNEHYVMKLLRETGLDRAIIPTALEAAESAASRLAATVDLPSIGLTEEESRRRQAAIDDAQAEVLSSSSAYLLRLQAAVVDTLRLHELLAGYLLPAGKTEADWTLAMARETADKLQALTDTKDKQLIHRLGLKVVFAFFQDGLNSLNDSLRSFARVSPAAAAPSRSAVN